MLIIITNQFILVAIMPKNNAVIIGLEDWKSIQETIYLESTGTMDKVREREKDNSGTTNIDDIDWDNL